MKITRAPRTTHFTVLSNDLIRDCRLSFKARGLLAWLLSQPDDWQTDAGRIAEQGPDGRTAILSALKELEHAGYLTRTRTQDKHGHWSTACEVTDHPAEVRFPDVGSPDVGFPDANTKNHDGVPPRPPTVVGGGREHRGQHKRCRACGTAGRVKKPTPQPPPPDQVLARCGHGAPPGHCPDCRRAAAGAAPLRVVESPPPRRSSRPAPRFRQGILAALIDGEGAEDPSRSPARRVADSEMSRWWFTLAIRK
jgi:hypothetical protein